jgi:hypothetical protein
VPAILWRRLDTPGFDRCELTATPDGHRLAGTALVVFDDVPYEIRYTVITDRRWRTRTVGAHVQGPEGDRRLALTADGEGGWSVSDSPVLDLYGAIDVDLAWTPATNTLPVNRLELQVGEETEITAAYIQFPAHEIKRVSQRYQRIADQRYLYSQGSFRAEVAVDENGLVVDYQGVWESVTSS